MTLDTNREVVAPIIFKIKNDFNCNLVFVLFLEGKSCCLYCPSLLPINCPSIIKKKTIKVAEIFFLQI